MLIRDYDEQSKLHRFFDNSNLGLPVKTLANALERDAEAISKESRNTIVYIGNKCIKSSILM